MCPSRCAAGLSRCPVNGLRHGCADCGGCESTCRRLFRSGLRAPRRSSRTRGVPPAVPRTSPRPPCASNPTPVENLRCSTRGHPYFFHRSGVSSSTVSRRVTARVSGEAERAVVAVGVDAARLLGTGTGRIGRHRNGVDRDDQRDAQALNTSERRARLDLHPVLAVTTRQRKAPHRTRDQQPTGALSRALRAEAVRFQLHQPWTTRTVKTR